MLHISFPLKLIEEKAVTSYTMYCEFLQNILWIKQKCKRYARQDASCQTATRKCYRLASISGIEWPPELVTTQGEGIDHGVETKILLEAIQKYPVQSH